MPLGLFSEFSQTLGFAALTNKQVLVLAVNTAKELGWKVGEIKQSGFIALVPASVNSTDEVFRILLWDGMATIKSASVGSQMVDWGINKKNIQAFVERFEVNRDMADTGELDQLYNDISSAGDPDFDAYHKINHNKPWDVFAIFRPVNGYFITPIIVDLNILVFMLMVISGAGFWSVDSETLLHWGADYNPLTVNSEWWRLITSIFLHVGFLHLFSNMVVLVYLGRLAEPHLGKMRFAVAYLLTGLTASIVSSLSNTDLVSAGASGAIFGVCGVLLALLTTNFLERSASKRLLIGLSAFVAYNLISGWNDRHIDYAAHIGGFVCGLFIGYAYYPSLKNPGATRLANQTMAGVSIAILAFCWFIFQNIPNDLNKYHNKMMLFSVMKRLALKADHLPKNMPKDSVLATLKSPGIDYWNKCILLLDTVDQLNLPDNVHQQNQRLKRYCTLYLACYKLNFKAVYDNLDMFRDSEVYYRKNIKVITDSLNNE